MMTAGGKVCIMIGFIFSLFGGGVITYAQSPLEQQSQQHADMIPSPQTHGEALALYVNDTLGDYECYKNKSYGSFKNLEKCTDGPRYHAWLSGPYFSRQNMSESMYYSDLSFYAEKPSEVFEIKVNLNIPTGEYMHERIVIPLRGYFYTNFLEEGMDYIPGSSSGAQNLTSYTSYYGYGQVEIGGNYWYNMPAKYQTWNNGFSYNLWIGGFVSQ